MYVAEKAWLFWCAVVRRMPSDREHEFSQGGKSTSYEHVCLVTANSGLSYQAPWKSSRPSASCCCRLLIGLPCCRKLHVNQYWCRIRNGHGVFSRISNASGQTERSVAWFLPGPRVINPRRIGT